MTQLHMIDEESHNLKDAAEMLWVMLANVSEGDWTKQSLEWQKAAAKWRDYYLKARSLKQFDPEPLEVQIKGFRKFWYVEYLRDDGYPRWLKSFYTEQEAIDFCAKHGLRVNK